MVVIDQQHMLIRGNLEQPCAQQPSGTQVKRRAGFLLLPGLDHRLSVPTRQRFGHQLDWLRWMVDLHHLAALQLERRAQRGCRSISAVRATPSACSSSSPRSFHSAGR